MPKKIKNQYSFNPNSELNHLLSSGIKVYAVHVGTDSWKIAWHDGKSESVGNKTYVGDKAINEAKMSAIKYLYNELKKRES
jgi:hypothetical protein